MTEPVTLPALPDAHQYEKEVSTWEATANDLVVSDQSGLELAGTHLMLVAALRKEIDATFDPIIKKAHEAHRAAIGAKKRHDDPLAAAETTIKRKSGTYMAQEEARRRQEAAEAARKARELEEERRLAEAAELEAAGQAEAAAEIIDEPLPPPPPPKMERPKAAGVQSRKTYTARVVSASKLIEAVALGDAPTAFLKIDQAKLNAHARTMKDEFKVPGCVLDVQTEAVRGR